MSDPSAVFLGGPVTGGYSPDGRWLVLTRREGATRSSLWTIPAAGGEAIRLTDTGHLDEGAVWAPSGNGVYFVSSRPARGGPGTFVMSIDVDPATGRATGSPRQITLERESGSPMPSPDGRSLAYRVGANEIRVVPASGGTSRLLTTTGQGQRRLAWEPDGSTIYFVQRDPQRGGGLYRVPVAGGQPELVLQLEGNRGMPAFHPGTRRLIATRPGPERGKLTMEVMEFSGRVLASHVLDTPWQAIGFSEDGTSLLASSADVGADLRVRPVQGGETRDLAGVGDYDWPQAWTADSRSVVVQSEEDGRHVVRIVPIDGGAARVVPLPPEDAKASFGYFGTTATHAAYMVTPEAGRDRGPLYLLDLASGERTVITENARYGGPCCGYGPGGLYNDLDGFLFAELVNDRVETRSLHPGSPARTLHSVPAEAFPNEEHGFQGRRVAFRKVVGDSVALMLAEPWDAAPRVLTMLGGKEDGRCCRGIVAFSYDGEWLALSPLDNASSGKAIILRVPAQGRATDIRSVAVDAEYWYEPRWLPDHSGFTILAGSGATAWVAFVPVAPGEPVRHLSRAEDAPTWGGQLVSPDGRWVVYPAEDHRGTKLWRLDLSALTASSSR